jgi:Spy/CpxP family protein refolding chaperone
MKFSQCFLLLSLVTSVAMTSNVRANEPDPFNKRLLRVELVMSFRKEINLTKQQSDDLGKLVVQMQQSVAQKQWEMQSDYFALIEALDKSRIDEDEALSLVKSAVDAENAIKVEQIRLLIRLRNLLSADQIQFLRDQLDNGWSDS